MHSDIEGYWCNQRGSEMQLHVSPEGRISGTFRSAAGLAKGADECELTGFISGDLVAFVTNFGAFDSLTSWVGHIVTREGKPALDTQWQMTVSVPPQGKSEELWKGTWTGSDTFTRHQLRTDVQARGARSEPLPPWP